MKKALVAIALLHIVLSLFVIFVVNRDSWFDVSFSLETTNKMITQGFNSVQFHTYDVHPPMYYWLLAGWQELNPIGISEYHWAQLLSVIFGVGFIVFATLLVKRIFGIQKAVLIGSFLALSTTVLHYSTEARMYSLVLFLSAMGFYGVIANGKWRYASILSVFLLPNVHYMAAIASIAIVFVFVILNSHNHNLRFQKKWLGAFVAALAIGIAFALTYAVPQRIRIDGMFFQMPTILSSIPSSLFYSLFTVNDLGMKNAFAWIVFSGFCISLFFFYWKVFKTMHKNASTGELLWVLFAFISLAPVVYVIGCVLLVLLGGGFFQLYHHRFFLSVTWLFAVAYLSWIIDVCSSLKQRWLRMHLSRILIIGIAACMFALYCFSAEHDLQQMESKLNCAENLKLGHESPFSALPFVVYARENNCNWTNFISTNLTVRQSRSTGFDIMPQYNVYFNLSLPDYEFIYVKAEPSFQLGNRSQELIASGDGISLVQIGVK